MDIPFFFREMRRRKGKVRFALPCFVKLPHRLLLLSPCYRVAVPGCSPCLPIAICWKSVQRLLPKKKAWGEKTSLGTKKKETREDFRFLWPVLRSIIFLFPSLPSKIRYFHGERKGKRGEWRIRQQHMNGPSSSPPSFPTAEEILPVPFSLFFASPPFLALTRNVRCPLYRSSRYTPRRTYNVQTMDNWT